MIITIHRGTKQIGGCVTEIKCDQWRLFIDVGDNLPGNDSVLAPIDGLTAGDGSKSALFLTHYHSDHVGNLDKVLKEIPVYIGITAKEIMMTIAKWAYPEKLTMMEKINTFTLLEKKEIGPFTVTPLMIDHSAFDAYMFLIDFNGCRILHTGDFRLHGQRGSKTLKMLTKHAKNVDYVICEGTMLSRDGEQPTSEFDLQDKAAKFMKTAPYVFVLCSSTNIDRIGVFYHANPKGRLFICDKYQKEQLDTISEGHAKKSSYYDFKYVYSYAPNLDKLMDEKGFCMLVRKNSNKNNLIKNILDKYKDKSLVIYSMWKGYLNEKTKDTDICDFLAPYRDNHERYKELHTSGHAPAEDLKRLFETVNPKKGLIPIHSEKPQSFKDFIPEDKLYFLKDRKEFSL